MSRRCRACLTMGEVRAPSSRARRKRTWENSPRPGVGSSYSPGWQISSWPPGAHAAQDLQDAHLVQLPALDVAPALGAVAKRPHAPAGEPGQATQGCRQRPAGQVGHPGQGRLLQGAAHAGDAVALGHRLHRQPHRGDEADVVVGVQVIGAQAGSQHALHLSIEFALDLRRRSGRGCSQDRYTSRAWEANPPWGAISEGIAAGIG